MKLSNIQLQMKSHICLNEHKMRKNFEKSDSTSLNSTNASLFGMTFIQYLQMHKIMCNRTLFILHKNVKPSQSHDVIEKRRL